MNILFKQLPEYLMGMSRPLFESLEAEQQRSMMICGKGLTSLSRLNSIGEHQLIVIYGWLEISKKVCLKVCEVLRLIDGDQKFL